MGEQSAARLEGDEYQHLYSWYELLDLLKPGSKYAYGYVEHPAAGAADDVTLHPKHDDTPAKFVQIKWHRDFKTGYSFEKFLEVAAGAASSLLQKLFKSWYDLRAQGPVEIWLVSNWSHADDLGAVIRARDNTFDEDKYVVGGKSNIGKQFQSWRDHLRISPQELRAFCRDLRLRLGFAGLSQLHEMVDDRMAALGLRSGRNARAVAVNIVSTWIQEGGEKKRVTADVLNKVIDERELRRAPDDTPKVRVYIHGWARTAFDVPPTFEVDWTDQFEIDTRMVPPDAVWQSKLMPQLRQLNKDVAALHGGNFIDFRGKLPLSASVAIGRVFSSAAGFRFRVEQPVGGETFMWRSDAQKLLVNLKAEPHDLDMNSKHLLVSLSITGDATRDVELLAGDLCPRVWLDISLARGRGSDVIRSAGEAVAIAAQSKDLIRDAKNTYGCDRVSLVLYCPASLALFLGQQLNALGEIATYERKSAGGYQPSVTIQTG